MAITPVRIDAPGSPLRIPYFRNLWLGTTVSVLGDQFYLVALPWLVLQLTGSSLALGTIMMAAAIPRALFMLMGGALTDRFAARDILLVNTSARTLLVAAIALLTWFGVIQVWHLYFLAFAFGIADAFSIPAGQALLPTLVASGQLTAANAMFQSSMQASTLIGPAPAGLIIKRFGLATAFFLDAVSFIFAIVPLARLPRLQPTAARSTEKSGVFQSIVEGLHYVWADRPLRLLVMLFASINLWAFGPVMVGLPVLAKVRYGSSAAFGTMMSCFSGGALAGMILAGTLKPKHHRGLLFLGFVGAEAVGIIPIALIHRFPVLAVVLVLIGIAGGLANVSIMAWIQGYVDRAILGRVMSVLMFAAFGLMPISLMLAGLVADLHLGAMFVVSGTLILATTAIAATGKGVRAIS